MKNIKTMIVPIASTIALGLGAALGLNHVQVDGVEKFIEYVADGVLVVLSWWGTYHSHDKKPIQDAVKRVESDVVNEVKNVKQHPVQAIQDVEKVVNDVEAAKANPAQAVENAVKDVAQDVQAQK